MTHDVTVGQRVLAQCDQLATFSDHPDYLCRAYLTREHRAANDQVAQWMHAIDMTTWEDSAGNLWGRFPGRTDGPALVVGSHLDTVRNAGRYDGMLGVLTPLAALAELHAAGEKPAMPVEIVAFADEEGTRFGTTLLGSRAVTGRWQSAWHDIEDADGVSLGQALVDFGLDPTRMHEAARNPADMAAYVELHIEQGPVLEAENLPLGVVTSINGARRLRLSREDIHHADAVPCDPDLQDRLAQVLTGIGQPDFRLPSGAGHDAMAMADITPVGMLFLRCDGGITHNPAEDVRADDVALGVKAMTVLLREGL